jgi:NDP-sugar pyrophosphorylase family protein
MLSLDQTISKRLFEAKEFPWEVLGEIGEFILKAGPTLDKEIYDQISENIWVAKNAKIYPSAHITAPAIIGENTEVRHCAFLRGNTLVGNNCVVGNSTELKNVILFNGVQVPHYNYVGDSILGYKAHMGAGSITSNVKSDKTLVQVKYGNEIIDSNRKKFGVIIGDNVEIGCGSVLNPGSVIGRGTSVYPLSSVRGYVPGNSIYKLKQEYEVIEKITC